MKKSNIYILILLAGILAGCNKDSVLNPTSNHMPIDIVIANIPVIANTQNAFTFDMVATMYTSSITYPLSFSTDTLACSMTITGQTSGGGYLKIVDSNNATVFADSAMGNKIAAFTQSGRGIPKNISLVFTNYTGNINFALSRSNAH